MGLQTFRSDCTTKLSQLKPNSTFLTIHKYQNIESKKIADWSLVFHFSYANALEKSIEKLKSLELKRSDCVGEPYTWYTLVQAKEELLKSWNLSLFGKNYSPSAESYDQILDAGGKIIPGIKLHRKQDLIHLYAFAIHCRIIYEGKVKTSNKYDLTIAKDDLRLRIGSSLSRWVQMRLEPGRFDRITVQHFTITDKEVLRKYNI